MVSLYYKSRYSDCPICACDKFEAGFVIYRINSDYRPSKWFGPDFDGIQQELEERFGLSVSKAQIEEHWDLHVGIKNGSYREWAREKTEDSVAADPYEMGWPKR